MTKINQPQGSSNSSHPSEWHPTPLTSSGGKVFFNYLEIISVFFKLGM